MWRWKNLRMTARVVWYGINDGHTVSSVSSVSFTSFVAKLITEVVVVEVVVDVAVVVET